MDVSGYVRGVPTYEDLNGNTYGMLCETKEKCITDDSGVALDFKLEELRKQIESSGRNASTLEGHNAAHFATAESVTNITDGTTQVGNSKTLDGHGAEDFLAKNGGGTVEAPYNTPLVLKNSVGNWTILNYEDITGLLGYIGFSEKNKPIFVNADATDYHELLHTGNVGDIPTVVGLREYLNVHSSTSNAETYSSFIQYNNGTHVRHVTDANNFDEIFIKKGKASFAKMDNGAWSEAELIHTGNSAKVVISETAPSDTTALWVW